MSNRPDFGTGCWQKVDPPFGPRIWALFWTPFWTRNFFWRKKYIIKLGAYSENCYSYFFQHRENIGDWNIVPTFRGSNAFFDLRCVLSGLKSTVACKGHSISWSLSLLRVYKLEKFRVYKHEISSLQIQTRNFEFTNSKISSLQTRNFEFANSKFRVHKHEISSL